MASFDIFKTDPLKFSNEITKNDSWKRTFIKKIVRGICRNLLASLLDT